MLNLDTLNSMSKEVACFTQKNYSLICENLLASCCRLLGFLFHLHRREWVVSYEFLPFSYPIIFQMGHCRCLFLYFCLFNSSQQIGMLITKVYQWLAFELADLWFGSNCSANWATTSAQSSNVFQVSFATFVLSDPANVLDSEKAFVALSLFNILRFPLTLLPTVITNMVTGQPLSTNRANKTTKIS